MITTTLAALGLAGGLLVPGTSSTTAADSDAASTVVAQLGGTLQVALAGAQPDANLVFSPASIAVALAMLSAGAAGDTATQIDDVLGITDPATIHDSMGALIASVRDSGSDDTTVSMADAVWLQDGMTVEPAFTDVLAGPYDSDVQRVDFPADPAAATDTVNQWVSDQTGGHIDHLIAPGALDATTRLVLVNALHLDAAWVSPFDPASTAPAPFTRPDASTVDADMMHDQLYADYAEGKGFQAVSLPYSGHLAMVVVLPDDLGAFEQALAAAGGDLDAVIGPTATAEVVLSLPTWTMSTNVELADVLRGIGLDLPFDADRADFSGITSDEPLHVSSAVHQADITVDEAGTEAAAATAIAGAAGAAPGEDPPIDMTVDHPFFFAIRDTDTGAVLFQGRVTDPTA